MCGSFSMSWCCSVLPRYWAFATAGLFSGASLASARWPWRERFPVVTPRVIPDNGPRFIAKDLKEFIRPWAEDSLSRQLMPPQSHPERHSIANR